MVKLSLFQSDFGLFYYICYRPPMIHFVRSEIWQIYWLDLHLSVVYLTNSREQDSFLVVHAFWNNLTWYKDNEDTEYTNYLVFLKIKEIKVNVSEILTFHSHTYLYTYYFVLLRKQGLWQCLFMYTMTERNQNITCGKINVQNKSKTITFTKLLSSYRNHIINNCLSNCCVPCTSRPMYNDVKLCY